MYNALNHIFQKLITLLPLIGACWILLTWANGQDSKPSITWSPPPSAKYVMEGEGERLWTIKPDLPQHFDKFREKLSFIEKLAKINYKQIEINISFIHKIWSYNQIKSEGEVLGFPITLTFDQKQQLLTILLPEWFFGEQSMTGIITFLAIRSSFFLPKNLLKREKQPFEHQVTIQYIIGGKSIWKVKGQYEILTIVEENKEKYAEICYTFQIYQFKPFKYEEKKEYIINKEKDIKYLRILINKLEFKGSIIYRINLENGIIVEAKGSIIGETAQELSTKTNKDKEFDVMPFKGVVKENFSLHLED